MLKLTPLRKAHMIKVFYGDDRIAARKAMMDFFGSRDYETIEAADLTATDLPNIFHGVSLFAENRRIMIRDFFSNIEISAELEKYLDTPHQVVLLETKIDKRNAGYKALQKKLDFREFKLPEPKSNPIFGIYRLAKTNGQKAVQELEKLQTTSDPQLCIGAFASVAMREYASHPGVKEKRVLRELSKVDSALHKYSSADVGPNYSWLLLQSFLLRLSSL